MTGKSFNFVVSVLVSLAIILGLSQFSVVNAQKDSEGEKLALYSKPAVVRLLDGASGVFIWTHPKSKSQKVFKISSVGTGSGLFVNPNGYIVTNAHVVETSKKIKDKGEDNYNEIKKVLFPNYVFELARSYGEDARNYDDKTLAMIWEYSELRDARVYHHALLPNGDVFQYEIKAYGAPVGEGKDVAVVKIEVKNAPTLMFGKSDDLQLQGQVTAIGYPGAADISILDNKSVLEASITDGKLSARKNMEDGSPVLQISAPIAPGNSGGPVLNSNGEVVGIVTFGKNVNGQMVQGFAFAVPTSTILEFMRQAGAENMASPTDRIYREGLELYWKGYFTKAITKFEETKRLYPHHSEVDRLITASQQAIIDGKEKSMVPTWLLVTILVLVVMAIFFVLLCSFGIGGFLLIRRSKKKRAMASQTIVLPVQQQPVSQPIQMPRPTGPNMNYQSQPQSGYVTNPSRVPSAA